MISPSRCILQPSEVRLHLWDQEQDSGSQQILKVQLPGDSNSRARNAWSVRAKFAKNSTQPKAKLVRLNQASKTVLSQISAPLVHKKISLKRLQKVYTVQAGNTNWRGRLSTVDLLFKVTCFVKKQIMLAISKAQHVHGGQLYWAFPFS